MAKKSDVAIRLLEKFLMPIVATAASGAAAYAAKKAPQVLGSAVQSVPGASANGHRSLSPDELAQRRDERAKARADRRKAVA